MALDDLYTALDRFNGSVKQLNLQRTLSGANEAVQQIRSSELSDDQKMNQLRGIAENLTFNLVGQGVPATTLEQLTSFVPKQPTTAEAAFLNGTTQQKDAAKGFFQYKADLEQKKALEQEFRILNRQQNTFQQQNALQTQRESVQQSKEYRSTLIKGQQLYNKSVKDINDASRYAKQGLAILNSDGGAEKMMGAVQFMAARASGSNSQLSDGERMALSGRADLLSKFMQLTSTSARSEFIKANKEALTDLFKIYTENAEQYKTELANDYAGQLKATPLFADQHYDNVISNLTGGKIKKYTGPGVEISPQDGAQQPQAAAQAPAPQGAGATGTYAPLPSWAKPRGK